MTLCTTQAILTQILTLSMTLLLLPRVWFRCLPLELLGSLGCFCWWSSVRFGCSPIGARDGDWLAALSDRRKSALLKWKAILAESPPGDSSFMSFFGDSPDELDILSSLRSVVSREAASTIFKRAADLQRFVSWMGTVGQKPFPVSEAAVYDYLTMVRHKPTVGKACRAALNFAAKRPTRRAAVLTVAQVLRGCALQCW
eukprot:6461762-Amphidinium_carterae.4